MGMVTTNVRPVVITHPKEPVQIRHVNRGALNPKLAPNMIQKVPRIGSQRWHLIPSKAARNNEIGVIFSRTRGTGRDGPDVIVDQELK